MRKKLTKNKDALSTPVRTHKNSRNTQAGVYKGDATDWTL